MYVQINYLLLLYQGTLLFYLESDNWDFPLYCYVTMPALPSSQITSSALGRVASDSVGVGYVPMSEVHDSGPILYAQVHQELTWNS